MKKNPTNEKTPHPAASWANLGRTGSLGVHRGEVPLKTSDKTPDWHEICAIGLRVCWR